MVQSLPVNAVTKIGYLFNHLLLPHMTYTQIQQVRQQDAHPTNAGGGLQLKLRATPSPRFQWQQFRR